MQKKIFVVYLFILFGTHLLLGQTATYTVKRGDNTHNIAQEYGITKDSLANLNPNVNIMNNTIFEGQILIVPDLQSDNNVNKDNKNNTVTKKDTEQTPSANDSPKNDNKPPKSNKTKPTYWWLGLIVGIIVGFILGKRGLNIKKVGNNKTERNDTNAFSDGNLMRQDELEKLKTENNRLRKENETLTEDIRKLKKEKKDFHEQNIELGKIIDSMKSDAYAQSHGAVSDNKSQQQNQQSTSGRLYAMAIIDGCLSRVSETPIEETIFELRKRGESRADVDIYRPAYEKILADVNYLDGCDKQVVGNSPSSVKVESLGEAVKDQDGFWRVTKKPNVIVR